MATSTISILQAGLACCGVEASSVDLVDSAWTAAQSTSAISAAEHILVIAGTVTQALIPTVQSAYDALLEPKVVVAFGACAITGGPYWDSYSVIPGADQIVPVDIYVPGCPPSPHDLAVALRQAIEMTSQ